jgi:hypothetical protein
MTTQNRAFNIFLRMVSEGLDIPLALYRKAVARHRSLGDWMCRQGSSVAEFSPHVSPQGSFRYGTVVRPLVSTAEYDLDNVTQLALPKTRLSQKALKELYGAEVKAYARAHSMVAPVEEKDRCWRLVYADDENFHLDTLPCVPEEAAVVSALVARGVRPHLAERAVAITDRRHPLYEVPTHAMLSSNPRGFARWFEEAVRPYALDRMRELVATRLYATVEEVPPYEWKTVLQLCIQMMKRHRDVMFVSMPHLKPISMIIANLAARAYQGERDLAEALPLIVARMPSYVNPERPRVPNPADPAEDYADKWSRDPMLEKSFWSWHAQLKADIENLQALLGQPTLTSAVSRIFKVELAETQVREIRSQMPEASPIVIAAPRVQQIAAAPKPWGTGRG